MWFVEGTSVRCNKCAKKFKRDAKKRQAAGYDCPNCRVGELETVWHMVDEAHNLPIGACDCEDFTCRKGPLLKGKTTKQLFALSFEEQEELRCKHIRIARNQSHNDTLRSHLQEQTT